MSTHPVHSDTSSVPVSAPTQPASLHLQQVSDRVSGVFASSSPLLSTNKSTSIDPALSRSAPHLPPPKLSRSRAQFNLLPPS